MFEPVRPTRVSEQVAHQIKALILSGQLEPGTRLPPERDLAQQFGLSRMTLRDALRALESRGFIRVKVGARGGVFASIPEPQQVTEFFADFLRAHDVGFRALAEARLIVEPEVAALAAQRATASDLEAMEQALAEARASHAAGDPYFIPHSVRFHTALAEAAKNPVLLCVVNSFRALFHEALSRLLPDPEMSRKALEDHGRILEAVRARDPDRARALMHAHLQFFSARLERLKETAPR